MKEFQLVDGKCPVCDTTVETKMNGIVMRFTPHDDPDWCRAAAMYHFKTLKRVIEQTSEERGLAYQRESFYRHAYALACRELSAFDHAVDWQERIKRIVREEAQEQKLARLHVMRATGLEP
jgi:hypothetical protein